MRRAPALLVAVALYAACAQAVDVPTPPRPVVVPPLALARLEADVVLPGTEIVLVGSGFVPDATGTGRVRFASGAGGVDAPATYVDERHLRVDADLALVEALGGVGSRFDGEVTLTFEYKNGAQPQTASVPAAFGLERTLAPRLDGASPDLLYLGSTLSLRGAGFLAPSEGGTRALLDGTFTPEGGATRPLQTEIVTRKVSRAEGALEIDPEIFGIAPGRFSGTVSLRNTPLAAPAQVSGAPRALDFTLGPAAVLEVSSPVRRGQRLVVRGRGFVPKRLDAGQATVLRLEGDFARRAGGAESWRGGSALELIAEHVSSSELAYVLRVSQSGDGSLGGLGLVPGTFTGQVVPILLRGRDQVIGLPLAARIEILPQRQVIYLKYLPGFTDALRSFGLRNMELEIRGRIRAVCDRDYARWNVEFRESRPTDYVEYSVVEIGGVDPNGQGLFGLDNTTGKDLGNLRFNDVIGGYNAETEEQGYLAYGGVFVESYLALSPRARDPLPIASPRFDEVFDRFREDRGGWPVQAGEYPFTGRKAAIDEAVRVLGNLIGTTVTHEIGHTLGMAIAEGFFHNPNPGPNQLMDSGAERPFEERAELDGQGPAEFEPEHVRYLDEILPKD
jgi:hypothetical protein